MVDISKVKLKTNKITHKSNNLHIKIKISNSLKENENSEPNNKKTRNNFSKNPFS
jgi:hypothetical protein